MHVYEKISDFKEIFSLPYSLVPSFLMAGGINLRGAVEWAEGEERGKRRDNSGAMGHPGPFHQAQSLCPRGGDMI